MSNQPTMRMFVPFILLLALCAGLVALILHHTAKEAVRLEQIHTRERVEAALNSSVDAIQSLTNDNALWDDAARAVYGPTDSQFFWTSWGAPTAESSNYSVAAVINSSGQTVMAFENGKASGDDMLRRFGPAMDRLIAGARATGQPAGGFVSDGVSLYAAGVDAILPMDRSLERMIPESGPHRLILLKRMDEAAIDGMSKIATVPGLQMSMQRPNGDALALIRGADGKPLAALTWTGGTSGLIALRTSLPYIVAALLLGALLASLVLREWYALMRQFHEEARTDSLSGLPNRRALRAELAERLASNQTVALAMLDLDGFKAVNDRFGHLAGDRLINEVSALLESTAEPTDRVARLGGDEFAIVVFGDYANERLEKHAQELLSRFASPFRIDDRTVACGVSIGLACRAGEALTAIELMRRADVALYAAKRAGKMRTRRYTDALDDAQSRARAIECDLRTALENDEFSLVYQPLYDHLGERIRAVEALLRWQRPHGEEVEPAEFIPIAEYSGLIDKIGQWVIRRACLDGLGWSDVNVAVNVSGAQLANPEFPALLGQVLEETGFPPIRLELEISERFLAGDTRHASRMIEEIRKLGVSVVLDEFGSGHSSVGFLRHFNFSKLKVDRTLSADAESSDVARTMIQANIAVARALGMGVTIAGIETESQAKLMRVSGCDELQGWHLSGEVSASAVDALVQAQRLPTGLRDWARS